MAFLPLHLFYLLPAAALGLGLAHYLGVDFSLPALGLGLTLLLGLTFSFHLLDDALRSPAQPFSSPETLSQRLQTRRLRLQAALAGLTLCAALAVMGSFFHWLPSLAWFSLGFFCLALLAWVLPPLRLAQRGWGEVVLALVFSNLAPLFFFVSQSGSLHRLLAAFVFPLTLQNLAGLLTFGLFTLSADQKFDRQTFVLRFGWQATLRLQEGLLLASYFLLAAAPLWNIPSALMWPGLFSLPLAGLQIFLLRRLEEGQPPLWLALRLNTLAVFGLTAYLLLFSVWTR